MNYLIHIVTMMAVYSIAAGGLNLLAGFAGRVAVCQGAFYGIGAYVAGLLALSFGLPFWVCVLGAVIACIGLGVVLGGPTLGTKGDLFVIATFAVQIVVLGVINNWVTLTNGPVGLSGIPVPSALGFNIATPFSFVVLVVSLAVAVFWGLRRLVLAPFGQVLMMIREDEVLAESLGKNVTLVRVSAFAICCGLAGLAGSLYAYYSSYIDPTSFSVMESVFMLTIVIVGGAGNLSGPVVGTVLLVGLPEVIRFIDLPQTVAAGLRQVFYGLALVACMIWRPQGLVGRFSFRDEERR
jgi:ABC-type branched-subunit amino acid transport system permease subunit